VMIAGDLLTLDGLLLTSTCLVFVLFFGGSAALSFRDGEAQSIWKGLSKAPKDDKK